MKIGINMATLRGCGSANVGKNVLREINRINSQHFFEFWVPDCWELDSARFGSNITLHHCKKGLLNKFFCENVSLRLRLYQGIEKLFSLGDTSLPFCRVPHMLMVQQTYLAYLPADLDFAIPVKFRIKLNLIESYFQAVLPTVSILSVQTYDMKRRIAHRWGFPEDRIVIVPSSVDITMQAAENRRSDNILPYVCYIASPYPHKNHEVLPDVMAALKRKKIDLVCRLTVTPESVPVLVAKAKKLDVLNQFEFMGNLSPERCIDLMAQATAMIMPSKLESFGLPYYEAMAVGCPVVSADKAFAREACEDAGLYSDANDGEGFAAHIRNLIESDTYWKQMSGRVKQRFSAIHRPWSHVASEYLKIIENL